MLGEFRGDVRIGAQNNGNKKPTANKKNSGDFRSFFPSAK